MKNGLRIAGSGFLLLGVGVVCFGLYLVGCSLFAPTAPPPSLNEGHGYAWFFGLLITVLGLAPFTIGLMLRSAAKDVRGVKIAAEPAVAADGASPRR